MGENSTVLKTINQGDTWEQIQIGEPIDIWDFQFVGDSSIYLVGNNKLMGSNNMGDSWQILSTFDEPLYHLSFFNDTSGFVIGENGIYKTNDKGLAWEAKWLFEENDYSFGEIDQILFLNDTLGFSTATGFRNNIPSTIDVFLIKTEDAGETWDSTYSFGHDFDFLISLQFINDSTGYIGNWDGHLYETTDLGESWVEITDALVGVTKTFFTSSEIGYATGAFTIVIEHGYPFGRIYFSSNGGEDWEITDTPGIPLCDLVFVNDSTGFAIGDYELILKTTSFGGPIEGDYPWDLFPPNSIEETGIKELVVNLSPNPFKKSFQINFGGKRKENVQVLIVNSMGIEVYRKFFKDIENIEIELPEIQKGFYFVQILADYGQKTIKVIKE